MSARKLKARFHSRFFVDYAAREISVGPGVRNGRPIRCPYFLPMWGTYYFGNEAPRLPQ